jgi:hypothetical protein
MNLKKIYAMSAVVAFLSCAGNPVSEKPAHGFTSDYIAYVMHPDYPTVLVYTICKDSVFCDTGYSHKESWSRPTVDNDFDSMSAILSRNGLCGMANPAPRDSVSVIGGCWGYGLEFRINGCTDTVSAPCQADAPATFKETVDSMTAKIRKYEILVGVNQ